MIHSDMSYIAPAIRRVTLERLQFRARAEVTKALVERAEVESERNARRSHMTSDDANYLRPVHIDGELYLPVGTVGRANARARALLCLLQDGPASGDIEQCVELAIERCPDPDRRAQAHRALLADPAGFGS